ncbi:MAG: sensor domain-containing protein [Mycobacterium sp.]
MSIGVDQANNLGQGTRRTEKPVKRELYAVACAGAVAVLTVGLSGTAAAAPQLVPQGKINSIVLSKDDVSSIVGATLTVEQTFGRPTLPADFGDKSACAVLYGLNSDAIGDDYLAFKEAVEKDGDDSGNGLSHIVLQTAAIYDDTDTPAKLFHDAFQSVSSCSGAVHVSFKSGGDEDWQVQPPKVTDSGAQWTMAELFDGKPGGWRCAHDVRLQSNVMLEAQVCQYGNPTRTASLLADRMIAGASS